MKNQVPDYVEDQPLKSHSLRSVPPTNNGKPWVNKPKVQIQERRETDRPPDHEIDWVGVWLIIGTVGVVVAVFGGTLLGEW